MVCCEYNRQAGITKIVADVDEDYDDDADEDYDDDVDEDYDDDADLYIIGAVCMYVSKSHYLCIQRIFVSPISFLTF